jgi:hypothetical protein
VVVALSSAAPETTGIEAELRGRQPPAPSATRAERPAANDLRASIEERWPDPAANVAAVRQAAERLAAERLLAEDVQAMVAAAQAGTLDRLRAP